VHLCAHRAPSHLTVVDNTFDVTVTKSTEVGYWLGYIWDAHIHEYTVTITSVSAKNIAVGFAPSKLYDTSKSVNTSCGWYLYLSSHYYISKGDTITCIYNASAGKIWFKQNGSDIIGRKFADVKGEDIAPVIELYDIGDSVALSIE
jgi:SPRY domain